MKLHFSINPSQSAPAIESYPGLAGLAPAWVLRRRGPPGSGDSMRTQHMRTCPFVLVHLRGEKSKWHFVSHHSSIHDDPSSRISLRLTPRPCQAVSCPPTLQPNLDVSLIRLYQSLVIPLPFPPLLVRPVCRILPLWSALPSFSPFHGVGQQPPVIGARSHTLPGLRADKLTCPEVRLPCPGLACRGLCSLGLGVRHVDGSCHIPCVSCIITAFGQCLGPGPLLTDRVATPPMSAMCFHRHTHPLESPWERLPGPSQPVLSRQPALRKSWTGRFSPVLLGAGAPWSHVEASQFLLLDSPFLRPDYAASTSAAQRSAPCLCPVFGWMSPSEIEVAQ